MSKTLLTVQEQARPELDQARRVEALVVERQTERDLPAQIEAHRLHRLPLGEPAAVGEEQDLGEQTGRDRGPPTASAEQAAKSPSQTIRSPCSASRP